MSPSADAEQATTVQPSAATGVIDGGWPYIWGAYSVTWVLLAGYAVSLFARAALVRGAASADRGSP